MKILIINNFNSENRLGGVEHYLHELIQYAKKNNSNFTFKWFGKDKIKTNWVEKFYHKTITQEIIREIESFHFGRIIRWSGIVSESSSFDDTRFYSRR